MADLGGCRQKKAEASGGKPPHTQKLTDGEIFYIIKNGVRFTGMPGWDFEDNHNWRLVSLIRQFSKEVPATQPPK